MWTELAEWGYLWGDPGRGRQELAERFPELLIPPEVTENGWAGHVSSETEPELVQRGALVLQKVLERHPRESDDCVFLVTHYLFINGFLSALFNLSTEIEFYHGYGGITQLIFDADGKIIVQWVNSTTHMWTKPLATGGMNEPDRQSESHSHGLTSLRISGGKFTTQPRLLAITHPPDTPVVMIEAVKPQSRYS